MCPYKESFDTYKESDTSTIQIGDYSSSKVIGIGTMKERIFNGIIGTLSNVKHVPRLMKSLISLGALDTLDYDFSIINGVININKGVWVAMKGKKMKNLYTLIGKTILGGTML